VLDLSVNCSGLDGSAVDLRSVRGVARGQHRGLPGAPAPKGVRDSGRDMGG